MGFRVVLVENEVTVKLKLNNLVINNGEGDIWIPVDDIHMIILDNLKISITTRVLCTLAEHNIGIVFCNAEHLPIGFYSSYDNHSRVSKVLGYQININEEDNDELWKQIICKKIENQREVLSREGKSETVISAMNEFLEELEPGDPDNRESFAAKIYFNEFFGPSFSRRNENIIINSGLNYGYSIVRSFIARACVGYGLNTQIGIHHRNEYNRFNLVDDLIEPVRPFVDLYVSYVMIGEEFMTFEIRRKLVNILNHRVIHKGKKMFVSNMLEEYVSEYASFLQNKTKEIHYPDIAGYRGGLDEV